MSEGHDGRQGEWRAARVRLFRGYAPLLMFVMAFALITLLVPSIAKEHSVTTVREGLPSAAASDTGTAGGASSGVATGGGAAAAAAGSSGATSGGTAASGTQPVTSGVSAAVAAKSGSGAAVTGDTTACPGQAEQVAGDPYSPPCIDYTGNNGGVTSPGVTATTITFAYRFPSDFNTSNQAADSLGANNYTATEADTERTINGLVNYFNDHFQFYGRKIKVVFYNGQGAITSEAQDEDIPQAEADAATVADQIHAWGDLSTISQPYGDALTANKIMSFDTSYASQAYMEQAAPYMWGPSVNCDTAMAATMEVVDKTLAGRNATGAGGALQHEPRKFALIAPVNPVLQQCANYAIALAKAAGVTISDDIQYELNINTLTAQDDNIVAQLSNDGITSVIMLTDPVSPLLLTARAAQQDYDPEWFETGFGGQDSDPVGQLYDQPEWSHAMGISFNGPTLPEQATLGYAAYKSANSDEPAPIVAEGMYEILDEVAIGLEMTGPDLTPANFEAGMRAYPGSKAGAASAQFGTWKFPVNQFNPVQDSWFITWNPNKTSIFNGQRGAYDIDSPRYEAGQYPTAAAPFPSGYPMTPSSG